MSPNTNKNLAKSYRNKFIILNVCFVPYLTISAFVWLLKDFSINDYLKKIKSSKCLAEYHQRAYYER